MALKILLADDSMTAQNMGKKILSDAGYEVTTVSNGAAAIKKVAEITPDIAVLDVYMPGYSGLEVCERMKTTPATARIPVLLTVGKMEPFRPEDGMKAKADGVIIKPFEATDLVAVVEKLAQRIYGMPPAKTAQEQPSSERLGPMPSVANEASADTPPDAQPAPILHCVVDEESEPVFSAAGLETFARSEEPASVATLEPHIEFTAAPQVDVAAERIADFEPTVLEEVLPAENATEHALDTFTTNDDATLSLPEPVPYLDTIEARNTVADQPSEPVWEAVETEPMDLDLEAEMRRAHGQQQPAADTGIQWSAEEAPESRTMAAGMSAGLAHATEAGVPLLAPIGKTSFDEFDSIMAETASKFETSAATRVEAEAGVRQERELADEEAQPAPDILDNATPIVDDKALEQPASNENATTDEAGEMLAGLISEEREESVFTEPLTMQGSDALSGVFDLDAEPVSGADSTTSASDRDSSQRDGSEPPAADNVSLAVATAEDAQIVGSGYAEPCSAEFDPATHAEEREPVWATIVPERAGKDLFLHSATGEGRADTAADAQAANNISIQSGSENEDRTDSTILISAGQDPAAMNALVERVVDRVLERLKPILVVTVEEILKEFRR